MLPRKHWFSPYCKCAWPPARRENKPMTGSVSINYIFVLIAGYYEAPVVTRNEKFKVKYTFIVL